MAEHAGGSSPPDCCSPKGYRWLFSERSAKAEARSYREKGLDATSRRIVEVLKQEGVEGRTVLEVGGGIGTIQIELLKAGASRATSIELTPTYEEVAHDLLREMRLEDRVDRRVMDFASGAASVEPADIVVMNRVICCYPDMAKLAGAGADHALELMVLSYPRRAWWTRIGLTVGNFLLRVTRREFQGFIHPPAQILATAARHGLHPTLDETGIFWTIAAMRRTAPG